MEPQEKIYCYDNRSEKKDKKKNCFGITTIIILVAFAFVIGLIIGAAISEAVLAALPAIIVLAIVLGLLLILSIVLEICSKGKDKKDKDKCCC
jgi:undecaprenyl pyrophosphate phosphatase UppP